MFVHEKHTVLLEQVKHGSVQPTQYVRLLTTLLKYPSGHDSTHDKLLETFNLYSVKQSVMHW